jgi:hypothetical protein
VATLTLGACAHKEKPAASAPAPSSGYSK